MTANPDVQSVGSREHNVPLVLTGLLLALFVAMLSGTIVSNALPIILSDLGGTQAAYTWVVTGSLLAMTTSTPIWGKLADLFPQKLLVQSAITIFIIGSMLCGLSTGTAWLTGFRVLQGLGMGGLLALAQVVIAAIIPPRERGRYNGYVGAVAAVSTVGGPLLGGLIVDTLGWRWCFYVTVPLALIALVVLQRTLHLEHQRRAVHIDYLGALLLVCAISSMLVWITLGGKEFAWDSWVSLVWIGFGLLCFALAIVVESRAPEPIIPPSLFRNRTVSLATVASLFIGVGMYASTVYLTQFFQLAYGASPTEAGLRCMPLILGLFVASTSTGWLISRYGRWKPYLVGGAVLMVVGLAIEGLIMSSTTPYPGLAIAIGMVGIGVGATQQNLVLAAQNQVALRDIGSASSTVSFFRSLGGVAGVAALGALLSGRVSASISEGLAALGLPESAVGGEQGALPRLSALPPPVREAVKQAYGESFASLFLVTVPIAVLALLAILVVRETPLRTTVDVEPAAQDNAQGSARR